MAPTVNIQGLKEDMVIGDGPVFPAACTTKIPAFTADSNAISIGLKKVAMPEGRLLGVIDKHIMSTPSWAACKQLIILQALPEIWTYGDNLVKRIWRE